MFGDFFGPNNVRIVEFDTFLFHLHSIFSSYEDHTACILFSFSINFPFLVDKVSNYNGHNVDL